MGSPRAAGGPRRPRLARMRWCVRARLGASDACRFVGAPALPGPARNLRAVSLHGPSVPRPPGTARALGGDPSLASVAALLVGAALRRPIVRRAEDITAVGDDRRAARNSCHASEAARDACGPPLLPGYSGGRGCPIPLAPPARAVGARTAERHLSAGARTQARGRACVDAVAQQVDGRGGRQQTQ